MARVLILGAGTPTPTGKRFGTSFVVEVGSEYLMFDCGPAATYKLVKAGLLPTQVNYLFFTVKDVGPGMVHEGKDWQVLAAPAEHVQPGLDSLAYRLNTSVGSIVFTGDTQPCQSVIELVRDAGLMLCMCWDDQDAMNENGEAAGQCGTTEAARMAQKANVKKLVLPHMGPHLSSHGPLEKGMGDIKRVYDGKVIFAEELMWTSI